MIQLLCVVTIVAGFSFTATFGAEPVLPAKQNVHVYLLMGQSNMAGRGAMTDADRQPVDGVIMLDEQDQWTPARHPIHFDKPKIAAFGLGLPFAEAMRKQAGDDVVIALVPCAFGGTPLSRWVRDADLYENAVRRAKIAAEDGVLMGALWHQGESDSGSAENTRTYGPRLAGMIRALRKDLDTPNLPVVVGEIGRFFVKKSKGAAGVNKALNALPKHVDQTACVSADDLADKGDTTHFDRAALVRFGRRYARAMVRLQKDKPRRVDRSASRPRPYSDRKPKNPDTEYKRFHPYALKLIVTDRVDQAIAFLNNLPEPVKSDPQTQLLLDLAEGRSAWKLDAETWPLPRTLPHILERPEQVAGRFTIAFGGGAGYVPRRERMWTTIGSFDPTALLLLGDNVYIDDPLTPQLQWYHYLRRQSQPQWRELAAKVPIYAIWDDHDFSTDDSWGGPDPDQPAWKRKVWEIFKANWANPAYGGGEKRPDLPGVWFDFRIDNVHLIMLDCRYYRENPRNDNPSMLGAHQLAWLKKTLAASGATFKVIVSSVPWAENVKPGSKDTWDGYPDEREAIYRHIADNHIDGVVLLSADRHRSDAYRIKRPNSYDLYEFSSSRLTNQHVHKLMPHALFGYNEKPSFGLVEFNTTADDPTVAYTIVNIDGEKIHTLTLNRSQLTHPDH